jgi:hypothetical protein
VLEQLQLFNIFFSELALCQCLIGRIVLGALPAGRKVLNAFLEEPRELGEVRLPLGVNLKSSDPVPSSRRLPQRPASRTRRTHLPPHNNLCRHPMACQDG